MRLKLIVALVSDEKTDVVIDAARAGGATIITSVRGEGLDPGKTFFGLDLAARRDVVLFLVIEPRARDILERIRDAGRFDEEPGAGVAFQVPIEDAVGLTTQLPTIMEELEADRYDRSTHCASGTSCATRFTPSTDSRRSPRRWRSCAGTASALSPSRGVTTTTRWGWSGSRTSRAR